ncbi:MAG TPA: flavin reductase family protein, partial [Anaerolineaceae bacterium]|nr:flavin reductase family protein [Anaerolineaceae bacterium]
DKYTNQLINELNEFGIHIPTYDQVEIVRLCGSVSGKEGANKYALAGITPMNGVKIKSQLINECSLNLECRVVHKVDYPGSHQWFVGEIVAVHRDENYSRDQALMFWGGEYRKVGEIIGGG